MMCEEPRELCPRKRALGKGAVGTEALRWTEWVGFAQGRVRLGGRTDSQDGT